MQRRVRGLEPNSLEKEQGISAVDQGTQTVDQGNEFIDQ